MPKSYSLTTQSVDELTEKAVKFKWGCEIGPSVVLLVPLLEKQWNLDTETHTEESPWNDARRIWLLVSVPETPLNEITLILTFQTPEKEIPIA